MKTYQISENRLRQLLAEELELVALQIGGVDNWSWYGESIADFLSDWLRENSDITRRWDSDDPRFEDLSFEDIADIEMHNFQGI